MIKKYHGESSDDYDHDDDDVEGDKEKREKSSCHMGN